MKPRKKVGDNPALTRTNTFIGIVLLFLLLAIVIFALFPGGRIATASTIAAAIERLENAGYIVLAAGEYNNIIDLLDEIQVELEWVEHHLHNVERWLGADAGWNGLDEVDSAKNNSIDPFQLDAGNDTWGTALCIIGSNDTPVQTGKTSFDFHRVSFSDTEFDVKYRVRFAWGATYNAAITSDNFTEIEFIPYDKKTDAGPMDVLMPPIASGTKIFAATWARNSNTATIDFTIGLHEYD